MLVKREHEHNLSAWRCPNCSGNDYWPKGTVRFHANFCSYCGIDLQLEEETYRHDFHDRHAERHRMVRAVCD